jgi:fructokinase
VVVVTDGGRSASAFRAEGEVSVPAESVPVVDTVGAGDSFAAAFLHALARSTALPGRAALLSLTDAFVESSLRFASRCAAVTVGRVGADPPHLEEVGEAF